MNEDKRKNREEEAEGRSPDRDEHIGAVGNETAEREEPCPDASEKENESDAAAHEAEPDGEIASGSDGADGNAGTESVEEKREEDLYGSPSSSEENGAAETPEKDVTESVDETDNASEETDDEAVPNDDATAGSESADDVDAYESGEALSDDDAEKSASADDEDASENGEGNEEKSDTSNGEAPVREKHRMRGRSARLGGGATEGEGKRKKPSRKERKAEKRKAKARRSSHIRISQPKRRKKRSEARRNVWLLVLLAVLLVGSVFMAYPPQQKINQGLDIQGGLSVVLSAHSTDGEAVTSDDMATSREIIESRVNALGASEATVSVQGEDQILVQIPGMTDADAALETIGKTGQLVFARLDSFTDEEVKEQIDNGQYATADTFSDGYGNTFSTGEVEYMEVDPDIYTPLVTGEHITRVTVDRASETSTDWAVNIAFDAEGTQAFADATRDLAADNGKIVIILDNEVQSAPAVQSEIPSGEVSITGGYTQSEANAMKTVLDSGSLPVSFEYEQSQVVGPTLGQGELGAGLLAMAIGVAIVLIYLLFFYRGFGLLIAANMACLAVLYIGILATMSHFGLFSLSLAGLAGIILTVGMAADSSILVIERFMEELKMGRSVKSCAKTAVNHGIYTSVDADVVTLISALALFFFASASVKGFGLTLALGIICDIIIMFIFKAPAIRLLAPKVIDNHKGFWGVSKAYAFGQAHNDMALGRGRAQDGQAPAAGVKDVASRTASSSGGPASDEAQAAESGGAAPHQAASPHAPTLAEHRGKKTRKQRMKEAQRRRNAEEVAARKQAKAQRQSAGKKGGNR